MEFFFWCHNVDCIRGHVFGLQIFFVRGAVGEAEGKIVFGRKIFRKGYRPKNGDYRGVYSHTCPLDMCAVPLRG